MEIIFLKIEIIKRVKLSFCLAILILMVMFFSVACKSSKIITKAIAPRDTTNVSQIKTVADSILLVNTTKEILQKNVIKYVSFSAKIKLDIEDSKGKKPDLVANVRMIKDSVIWISITAPILLNTEVYRALITKDSVILVDKQEREIHYRSIDYLQELTNIPFDLKTIQDLIVGNIIFFDENNMTIKKLDKFLLVASFSNQFKNLVTFSASDNLLQHCKLDDVNILQNRTADFSYDSYTNSNGIPFSTYRQIIVAEKNKLDVRMNFKQFDFNKELSVSLSIPKNYKKN